MIEHVERWEDASLEAADAPLMMSRRKRPGEDAGVARAQREAGRRASGDR